MLWSEIGNIHSSEFNKEEWQWKYEIDSESIDGDPITVILAVDSLRKEFIVVTRWRESE